MTDLPPVNPPAKRATGLLAFISVLAIIGVVALILSINNAVDITAEKRADNRERIQADLQACERGNGLRRTIQAIGLASEQLVDGSFNRIFTEFETTERARERVAQVRADLEPLFEAHRKELDKIEFTDCAAIPGAANQE